MGDCFFYPWPWYSRPSQNNREREYDQRRIDDSRRCWYLNLCLSVWNTLSFIIFFGLQSEALYKAVWIRIRSFI